MYRHFSKNLGKIYFSQNLNSLIYINVLKISNVDKVKVQNNSFNLRLVLLANLYLFQTCVCK